MRNANAILRAFLAALILGQTIFAPLASAENPLAKLKRLVTEASYHGTEPSLGQDGAMECLAEHIDWVEHHIDTYGSVVTKQPDIWGEARLTKHRDEYERMMFREIDQFNESINASISQSDSSFLAQAIALSNAAGATVTPADAPAGDTTTAVAEAKLANAKNLETDFTSFGFRSDPSAKAPGISLEPTVLLDQRSRYLDHLHELRRINEGDDTSDSPGYSLNLVRIPVSILPGKLTREGFGAEVTVTAEPVISDDLLPTTFQNLVVNDVVDFLGLPLVRVTERLDAFEAKVSLVAARNTVAKLKTIFKQFQPQSNEQSFILEAKPYINDFLENDLAVEKFLTQVTQFKEVGLTKLSEQITQSGLDAPSLTTDLQASKRTIYGIPNNEVIPSALLTFQQNLSDLLQESWKPEINPKGGKVSSPNVILLEPDQQAMAVGRAAKAGQLDLNLPLKRDIEEFNKVIEEKFFENFARALEDKDAELVGEHIWILGLVDTKNASYTLVEVSLAELAEDAEGVQSSAPSGRTRRALYPLNPSSIQEVMGIDNLLVAAKFFDEAYYGTHIRWAGGPKSVNDKPCVENRVDLLDARRFLNAEAQAAYELLSDPEHLHLYAELASPESMLASQIRGGHFERNSSEVPSVDAYRSYFFSQLHQHGHTAFQPNFASLVASDGAIVLSPLLSQIAMSDGTTVANKSVEVLAWAIVVESALLNERLNQDVRKLANAQDAYRLRSDQEQCFFLPDTVMKPERGLEDLQVRFQSANEVFKEYVRVRWPIHVFAVDPVAQDQNVADVSQRRRELQFALALGFATGQIGVNSLTQFSREMETQIETISLNRTIVGFGHGRDTFGWRFYPRVQALETPGTLGALCQTIMGTSRDGDLKHRRIEPGQRECVAMVLMPSFVPYADFNVRTNWFKLTNPKNSALTMKDSLKLSRAITAMRNSRANCAQCQHLYRDGELERLLKRVDQLDRELPLQTQRSLVPYENTLGGFEMFNTGVTDLSPELIGWYGAPGINVSSDAGNCSCSLGCVKGTEGLECKDAETCSKLTTALENLNNSLSTPSLAACEGKGTTLFLVGDNFSVHDTKVLAGGLCIPHVRLISRELMQVTIPHCVNTVELCENGQTHTYVSVYVATPYGVTNHLHVPVMGTQQPTVACPPANVSWTPATEPNMIRQASMLVAQQPSLDPPSTTSSGDLSIMNDPISTNEMTLGRLTRISEQLTAMEFGLSELVTESDVSSLLTEVPSQISVIVNMTEPGSSRARQSDCDLAEFPGLKRLRTAVREQWRNCKDQLPCN